ncbi:MAG: hypothetical protein ACI814_004778, partial [Mariniblastus sp.]
MPISIATIFCEDQRSEVSAEALTIPL